MRTCLVLLASIIVYQVLVMATSVLAFKTPALLADLKSGHGQLQLPTLYSLLD